MRFTTISGLSGRIVQYTEVAHDCTSPSDHRLAIAIVLRDGQPERAHPYSVHNFWIVGEEINAMNGKYDLGLWAAEHEFARRLEVYEHDGVPA